MTDFSEFAQIQSSQGSQAALEAFATRLIAEKNPHELFETRKMQVRCRLGLAPIPREGTEGDLSEQTRRELEDGLIEACREAGEMLLKQGKIREGWMYLRPVGDKSQAAKLLAEIEVDEDNADDLVEVLLHEGVNTGRGFQILLDRNGTCNSITLYDQVLGNRSKADRQAASAALLKRLHEDLLGNVQADIARQEGANPSANTLAELVKDREWMFQDGAYHIDTTHLASVIRLSRVLETPEQWRLALDLTDYGSHLAPQLQYQGDEPFIDQYPANRHFYSALLGIDQAAALEYFASKANILDCVYHGTAAIETYVELLARCGRSSEALAAALKLMPTDMPSIARAPQLLELCEACDGFDSLLKFCEERNDRLGYVSVLTARSAAKRA